jgi:hypothetical protein
MPNRYQGAAPSGHAAQQQFMQQGQQPIQQQYQQRQQQLRQGHMQNMSRAHLADLTSGGRHHRRLAGQDFNTQNRILDAQRQNMMGNLQRDAFATGELARRDATRDELFGRAREAIDDVPITDQIRDAILSQGADQGAAMERSQLAGMGAMGARPGDPAFESMRMQTGLGRQQGAQAMTRDMAIQQQLMNHAHRQQADRRLQDLLAGEEFGVSLPTRQLSLQDYMRMRGG